MGFIVIYDANVLYPGSLRDLLIRVAQAGLVQAKWTDRILDETFRNLKLNRPDLDPVKLDRTRELMNKAIRDVLVMNYEPLIEIVDLPDADDRHVLAAAIKAHAQLIVTDNTKDFPEPALASWNVEAKSADDFVLDLIDLNRSTVYAQVQRMADAPAETSRNRGGRALFTGARRSPQQRRGAATLTGPGGGGGSGRRW
ncbi:PIN domain-containing protein [Kribbella pittospori]|uniref:PIN domain-containing protein n=1 Tax=Kribbella pittospori TaxID=722689 RepID=UPI00192DC596|nr:PIN domain-containing protein [Kribbella pittospori]